MDSNAPAASRHGRHAPGTTGISLRISPQLKARLFALAAKKQRTPSDYLRLELTKIAARAS
jgi:predicted transcriptional regulator